MAWFGPKGIATMAFAILVLGRDLAEGVTIFNLAALTVFCSIIAHGVTDTAGARWIARRGAEPAPVPSGSSTPPASAAPAEIRSASGREA